MKHLFILLISILLLSSPLFGDNHKGETLYRWGNTLPYVWKGVGDKETHPVYKGQVKDGKPNGLGIMTYQYQVSKTRIKYVGEWKDGKKHGQGTETWSSGWKYFGSWKNGEIWNGTEYDNYGNIIYRWVEGKRKYHNLYKSY